MATNRLQIRTKFGEEVRIDKNSKIWTEDIRNSLFVQAYLQVQKDGHFNWDACQGGEQTISLVNGTQEYTGSTDIGRIEMAFLSNVELVSTTFNAAKRNNPSSTTGTPSAYYRRGASIGLDPVPNGADASAVLYYRKKLAAPTDDATNIDLSDELVPLIVKYMAYLAWSQPSGNTGRAAEKLSEYTVMLDSLLAGLQWVDPNSIDYSVPRRGKGNFRAKAFNNFRR